MRKTETVLLFHMNVFRAGQLSAALRQAGIQCRICTEEEERRPLLTCFDGGDSVSAGTTSRQLTAGDLVGEEMIVLGTYSEKERDRVLQVLKEAGAGGVLKAVLTGTNGFWSAGMLYRELVRERDAMQGR